MCVIVNLCDLTHQGPGDRSGRAGTSSVAASRCANATKSWKGRHVVRQIMCVCVFVCARFLGRRDADFMLH